MLVLVRRLNESVVLGDDVVVTVERIGVDSALLRAVSGPIYGSRRLIDDVAFELLCGDRREIAPDVFCDLLMIVNDKVRLGFTLPAQISLHRKEIYDSLHNRSSGE